MYVFQTHKNLKLNKVLKTTRIKELIQLWEENEHIVLKTIIVHERFIIIILFYWVFEKTFITCSKFFIIIIKYKNMQVFDCWVWIVDLKVQELKDWNILNTLDYPINITRMGLLFL